MMKYRILIIAICTLAVSFLLGGCGSTGRNGVGPYDFTDYASLEAKQELEEARMEATWEARYGDPFDYMYSEDRIDRYDIYEPPEDY